MASENGSNDQILMYAGYILIALAVLFIILVYLYKKGKKKQENLESGADINKVAAAFHDNSAASKPSFSTVELKAETATSADYQSGMVSSSLVVLTSPEVNGLRFEDLLKAPAELIGRGKHGSVYKVVCEAQGMNLAVKRIKDWTISNDDFKQRMTRLNRVKHPNVLPAVAFYSSKQEKLLVYEYQKNGSLFRQIHAHGNQSRQSFDWSRRLSAAATIADALAFMHEELQYERIAHGNLKSSNILLNENMEPCISEYGLMSTVENIQEHSLFKEDTYAFGVILLELLTGRTVLNEGLDLASWVLAVVSEEWTVEVFDKSLIREGASEERMVNVLQVAIKCVNKSFESRPNMRQVALSIRAIIEDDEKSMDASELSVTRSFIDL
ncbi:hypothetical protein ACP275_08G014200 [Erythranthe tilingii]